MTTFEYEKYDSDYKGDEPEPVIIRYWHIYSTHHDGFRLHGTVLGFNDDGPGIVIDVGRIREFEIILPEVRMKTEKAEYVCSLKYVCLDIFDSKSRRLFEDFPEIERMYGNWSAIRKDREGDMVLFVMDPDAEYCFVEATMRYKVHTCRVTSPCVLKWPHGWTVIVTFRFPELGKRIDYRYNVYKVGTIEWVSWCDDIEGYVRVRGWKSIEMTTSWPPVRYKGDETTQFIFHDADPGMTIEEKYGEKQ